MFNFKQILVSFTILLAILCSAPSADAGSQKSVKLDATILFTNLGKEMATKHIVNFPTTQNVNKETEVLPLILDVASARAFFNDAAQSFELTNFPVESGKLGDIELKRTRSIIDANTKFYHGAPHHRERIKGITISSFEGTIKDDPDSKVFLNFFDGEIYGYISHSDGRKFDIVPDMKSNVPGAHLVGGMNRNADPNGESMYQNFSSIYDNAANANFESLKKQLYSMRIQGSPVLEAPIALEGAYDFYCLMGKSTEKAAAYITAVMTHVSKIYENELNLRMYITSITVYDNPNDDPYNSITSFPEKLYKMPLTWGGQPDDASLLCLFTSLNSQPSSGYRIGGISFGGEPGKGSICNAKTGYSVFGIDGTADFSNFNYTWDVSVAAHEMGHNFSSPHTHNCYWAPEIIDTCVTKTKPTPISDACFDGEPRPAPGSIMSYCHLTNSTKECEMTFTPKVAKLMRTAAERSGCIKAATDPIVRLLEPLGGSIYKIKETIPVRWISSNVSNINLKFSTDGGSNWTYIAKNVAAADSIYKWTPSDISSAKVALIIEDAVSSDVADTSITNFSILQQQLQLVLPTASSRFGQKEYVKAKWNSVLVNSVNLLFSPDGGSTWSTIKENLTGTDFSFASPDVKSENCFVKVVDVTNNSLVSMAGPFAIGAETITILAPKAGEELCANVEYNLRWKSDFVANIYPEYSLDNGTTWKKITMTNVDGYAGTYSWKTPRDSSKTALVRMSSIADKKTILAQSEPFKLVFCANDVDNRQETAETFRITEVSPNPARNVARVTFNNGTGSTEINAEIMDARGAVVASGLRYAATASSNTIEINVSGLASGSYYIVLKSGNFSSMYPLSISR